MEGSIDGRKERREQEQDVFFMTPVFVDDGGKCPVFCLRLGWDSVLPRSLDVDDPLPLAYWIRTVISKTLLHSPCVLCFLYFLVFFFFFYCPLSSLLT